VGRTCPSLATGALARDYPRHVEHLVQGVPVLSAPAGLSGLTRTAAQSKRGPLLDSPDDEYRCSSMTSFHWFLPTNGDGRHVSNVVAGAGARELPRPASLDHLGQIARAAELSGFDAILTPTGSACEDAWLTTAALISHTRTLRFLVAFRPGFVLPALAAQQAATFQRLSGGRLAVNVVTGGDPAEQRAYGDTLAHDERYARTDEFLTVVRGLWGDVPFDHRGVHYEVTRGGFPRLPSARPPIYFGGASPAAELVAARHADVYLAWGEPVPALVERITRVRALAGGRPIRFGVRLHVIARDTADEAWDEADRLLAGMDPVAVAAAQERFARLESVGQRRMNDLTRGLGADARSQQVAPNLWAGIGLLREGAGTALVGSHDEVAQRIAELTEAGFDELILSGWPHVEEAYRVGEEVLPRVAALQGAVR
jgi:alkanesulfonate monooxygenase